MNDLYQQLKEHIPNTSKIVSPVEIEFLRTVFTEEEASWLSGIKRGRSGKS